MATLQTIRETKTAGEIFHLALAYLGYDGVTEAYTLFARVDDNALRSTTGQYRDAMASLAASKRGLARSLGIAYYRLLRALMTGTTLALPGTKPKATTLGELRNEFMETVESIVPDVPDRIKPTADTRKLFTRARLNEPLPSLPKSNAGKRITEEPFDWPEDLSEAGSDAVTENRLDDILDALARKRREREERRKEARDKTAVRQAGVIQHGIANAGRKVVSLSSEKDKRTVGYARASRSGNPCYFCAMIISRGLILYESESVVRDGVARTDGDLYHDNCNCYSVPVYSREQYMTDKRFALNRELNGLWKRTIRNRYSGNDALNEWRRVIRDRKVRSRLPKDAQVAS